ncbi:MAG: error-prone DNA polymerase [Pirellulaceae bacterium]
MNQPDPELPDPELPYYELPYYELPYYELHCKTNFSFLEGASHADELFSRAAELGYAGVAITDRNSLSGIVRAHVAAKETNVPLIVGAEITPDDALDVLLWVTNRAGYAHLSRLITVGRRRAAKGECRLHLQDIADHGDGLLVGVIPAPKCEAPLPSGAFAKTHPGQTHPGQTSMFRDPQQLATSQQLLPYREIFGDRAYVLAELHHGPDDHERLEQLSRIARQADLPLVAASDVHYHVAARLVLHDVLSATRWGTTVDQIGRWRFANAQRHMRDLASLRALYRSQPEVWERTVEIGTQCTFSLSELRYEYPEELAPDGLTPIAFLQQLTWQGARRRYPEGLPDKVRQLLEHELQLIEQLQYEAYFLTVWDLVRFARKRDILCQGRGSAANSAVCYCLGVTSVDPDQMDVLFERFVSRERNEAPDIDVDFEHERREEVLQYLYDKYGRQRAGMTAEVITYRVRSAIRDAGKALGLSLDRVDALAKQVEGYHRESNLSERCQQVGIDPTSETGQRLVYAIENLVGFPRHLSQHVGGMVMTRGPLCELVPIENASMPGRTVISWDKNDLDDLGILKVDCLSLGMLTAIRKAFEMVRKHTGDILTLANIPAEDPRVYDMVCRADTIGVFQIESRAQMSMLPRLRPRCFYDLVIEVAIVRPGPIQGQMVHPYLRRRAGDDKVVYASEPIRQVLEKTLGVPIFQEQAMRLAVVAAGFTPGEADQLRRAMGAWRRPGVIDQFRVKLIEGMTARGLSITFAEQVFQQIRGFGEYGFPESHAASFALLVYVSAWIKCHYPAMFAAAIINSQPMGFYAPAQLIRDARSHGVGVLPIDVNHSDWDCTLEEIELDEHANGTRNGVSRWSIRLGMRLIGGFSEQVAARIVEARKRGRFTSIEELTQRVGLSRAVVTQLAEADALASLGRDRRRALWDALAQEHQPRTMPLLDGLQDDDDDDNIMLPATSALSEVFTDYAKTGVSLRAHPISFFRSRLSALQVTTALGLQQVRHNRRARVAGLVLLRQRPSTAKGITFVTLEDETGTINLVLHQKTWERFYTVARRSPAWLADGRVESKYGVIHLVVDTLQDMAAALGEPSLRPPGKSRDFR